GSLLTSILRAERGQVLNSGHIRQHLGVNDQVRLQFRKELAELQANLIIYTQMLADMAGVEDLTALSSQD
ncbi:MAG: hypothetical protein ACLQVD_18350, partial [Capsulimonadaceae bacterium]